MRDLGPRFVGSPRARCEHRHHRRLDPDRVGRQVGGPRQPDPAAHHVAIERGDLAPQRLALRRVAPEAEIGGVDERRVVAVERVEQFRARTGIDLRTQRGLDQHQRLDAPGVCDRLGRAHQSAERVSDQHHRARPALGERVVERGDRLLERERIRHVGDTVARQIDQRHLVIAGEDARGGEPVRARAAETVDQHDRGAAPEARLSHFGHGTDRVQGTQPRRRDRGQDEWKASVHGPGRRAG